MVEVEDIYKDYPYWLRTLNESDVISFNLFWCWILNRKQIKLSKYIKNSINIYQTLIKHLNFVYILSFISIYLAIPWIKYILFMLALNFSLYLVYLYKNLYTILIIGYIIRKLNK